MFILIPLFIIVLIGIAMFKPEWVNKALVAITALAATLAAFGEPIVKFVTGFFS